MSRSPSIRWSAASAVVLSALAAQAAPPTPALVGQTSLNNLAGQDIDVVGTLAYVAINNFGLKIYDVSDVTQPSQIGAFDLLGVATPLDVAVLGDTAFVATFQGIYSVDVSDPMSPQQLAFLPIASGQLVRAMETTGNLLVAAINGRGLVLFEIGTEGAITEVGSAEVREPRGVAIFGNLAATSSNVGANNVAELWDISDPTTPVLADTLELGAPVSGLEISGRSLLYGLNIYNGPGNVRAGRVCVVRITPAAELEIGGVQNTQYEVRGLAYDRGTIYAGDYGFTNGGGITLIDTTQQTGPFYELVERFDAVTNGGVGSLEIAGPYLYAVAYTDLLIYSLSGEVPGGPDCLPDVDGNGTLDLFDILGYFELYSDGC